MLKWLLFVISFSSALLLNAQAQNSKKRVSGLTREFEYAQALKDSLKLTDLEKHKVYTVNVGLYKQKMALRDQYKNNMETLKRELRKVENSRDSLYKNVLTREQFTKYKTIKEKVIN